MSFSTPQSSRDGQWLRHRMVIEQLRDRGIKDERVLHAMSVIPREEFVPEDSRAAAYDDRPLPIGHGQTISQPFTVAFMCEALRLHDRDKVLEVGTGSGYGAAVLSLLASEVVTIECIPELADAARSRIDRLGFGNVQVLTGDGTLGAAGDAPFDAIVVTAGAASLPAAYIRQLRDRGRIVIPIGDNPHQQTMMRYVRHHENMTVEDLGSFAFVPLIGADGWSSEVDESNDL